MRTRDFEYNLLSLSSHKNQTLDGIFKLITESKNTAKLYLSKSYTHFKINRLSSALDAMSDYQLDKIGLSRKDIRHHAEELINYEYDGL
jgi:hypothetical protein